MNNATKTKAPKPTPVPCTFCVGGVETFTLTNGNPYSHPCLVCKGTGTR